MKLGDVILATLSGMTIFHSIALHPAQFVCSISSLKSQGGGTYNAQAVPGPYQIYLEAAA
jgi:hypothetical protein